MQLQSQRELAWAYGQLRLTGRGKHVGGFSYYHTMLLASRSDVRQYLDRVRDRIYGAPFAFNVVKLNARSRVSFLRYEDFAVPFPALLAALSCNLPRGTARRSEYAGRRNPPILHRKELLLPGDHLLVPEASRLTDCLEKLGAFEDARRIGTREGWSIRLKSLGLTLSDTRLLWDTCLRR